MDHIMNVMHRKANRYRFVSGIFIHALIILFFGASIHAQEEPLTTDLMAKILREVADKYLEDIPEDQLIQWGLDGMLSHLDPYSDFYTMDRIDQLQSITTGEYDGVGLYMDDQDGTIIITQLIDNSPASRAGILPGDEIVLIDGANVSGRSLRDISALVKGRRGSALVMGVRRIDEADVLSFSMVREKIEIQDIPYWGVISAGIGYVRLMHFSQKAPVELIQALEALKGRQISRLVLDLRGNPGGLLSSAVGVADLFAKKGDLIVTTRGRRNAYSNEHRARKDPSFPNLSLVILVNKSSASAAEIVAGAIQDLDLGLILGSRTFGKGLVQTVLYPSVNSAMKLTTAKYYTPSGRCIQGQEYLREGAELVTLPAGSKDEIFYTANGRLVYGGGGILPDIEIPEQNWSREVNYLKKRSMFLKFATYYVATHPRLPIIVDINTEIKMEFVAFLANQKAQLPLQAEDKVEDLIRLTEKLELGEEPLKLLKQAQKYYFTNIADNLDLDDPGIAYFLEQEINWVKDGERGRIAAILDEDPAVLEAISILSDPARYNQYLNNTTVTKLSEKRD